VDVQHQHHRRRLNAVIDDFVADSDLHDSPCFKVGSVGNSN
jgi:hypothetical protein